MDLAWPWGKRTVLGKGDNQRLCEVCLPGEENLEESLVNNQWGWEVEGDGDTLYDLHRRQGRREHYQKILFQVEALLIYGGIRDLKGVSEEGIKMGVDKAKGALQERDEELLKRIIGRYVEDNGRHYNNSSGITEEKGKLYENVKTTILGFVEDAATDVIEEVEFHGLDLEGINDKGAAITSIELRKLRAVIMERISQERKQICRMEEENGWTKLFPSPDRSLSTLSLADC